MLKIGVRLYGATGMESTFVVPSIGIEPVVFLRQLEVKS